MVEGSGGIGPTLYEHLDANAIVDGPEVLFQPSFITDVRRGADFSLADVSAECIAKEELCKLPNGNVIADGGEHCWCPQVLYEVSGAPIAAAETDG